MLENYSKLLRSRRWKTKRKRIIYRDGGGCTVCRSKENLCVHHTYYYEFQVKPWEYPDECLITLCEKCHNDWHQHHENVYIDNPLIVVKKKFKKRRTPRVKKKKQKVKYKRRQYPTALAKIQENSYTDKYRKKVNGEWVVIEKHKPQPPTKAKI